MNKLLISFALLTLLVVSNSSLYARAVERGGFEGRGPGEARHYDAGRPGGYGNEYHGNVNPAHAYDRGYQQGVNQGAAEGAAVDQGQDVIVVPQDNSSSGQSSQGN